MGSRPAKVLSALSRLHRTRGLDPTPNPQRAIRFFTFSNTYLALLFAAIAVDVLVRAA